MSDAPPPSSKAAAAALRWLINAGADTLVADKPGNWLQAPARLPARPVPPVPRQANLATGSPLQAAPDRSGAAFSARTLDELREEAEARAFAVRRPEAPLVFADGNPESGIMIVGEAPGAEEERRGKPFVGPAGQLLDKMLAAIGLDRSGVYIANLSPWRPGANRVPTVQEAAELLPLLHRHIAIAQPRLLLAMGGASTKALLGTSTGIMRLRGRWRDVAIEGASYPVMPTFHPAYLLREPACKREAWQDLLAFRARAEEALRS